MFGQSLSRCFLGLGVAIMLVGCLPIDELSLIQPAINQPDSARRTVQSLDQQSMFVADSRMGRIQAFRLGGKKPVFQVQSEIAARRWVLDLKLDATGRQLWVLGDDGVSVHDALTLTLQKHISFTPNEVVSLRIEDGRVVLVSGTGQPVGQIDCQTLLASWHAAARRS